MNLSKKVYEAMMANDKFSQWMDIQLIDISSGYCKISMIVKSEMLNGFDIVHGGIYFSFADSALAFACNADNKLTLSINGNINFQKQSIEGDLLIAEAKLISKGNKISTYTIVIMRDGEILSTMNASVYHTKKNYLEL